MNNKHQTFASFQIRDFKYFLSFRFLLTFAIQMQGVIVGWQVYEITNDPLSLGIIGLSEAIPYLGTSLLGGYLADIVDRKRINIICGIGFTLCSLILLFITLNISSIPDVEYYFYAIIFLTGIARGFIAPSVSALFAQIIPRDLYVNAAAWNSNVWLAAAVGGPAMGGILYGTIGVVNSYYALISISALSVIFMFMIPSYPFIKISSRENIFSSIKEGITFVFSNQVILGALSLDMIAVLFGGAIAVLPIFAKDVLNTGPEGLGYLRAAPFLGSVIMGIFLATQRPMQNAGKNLLICVAGFGACMICFALSENFYLSFCLLVLSGMFDNVSVVIRATILQLMTPDNMRGRVSAVNNIFVGSSNELGAFESGVAAKFLGLIPSVVIGGSISIAAAIIAYYRAPLLRKMNLRKL